MKFIDKIFLVERHFPTTPSTLEKSGASLKLESTFLLKTFIVYDQIGDSKKPRRFCEVISTEQQVIQTIIVIEHIYGTKQKHVSLQLFFETEIF